MNVEKVKEKYRMLAVGWLTMGSRKRNSSLVTKRLKRGNWAWAQ